MRKIKILLLLLVAFSILSSCTNVFNPPSLPGSYSISSAIFILDGKYRLVEIDEISSLYGVELGKGLYGIFDDFDGMFYVFKCLDKSTTKENWKKLTSRFGSILKINYFKMNLIDRGYMQTKFQGLDVIIWWKDKWLFAITGKDSKEFYEYVNKVYRMVEI